MHNAFSISYPGRVSRWWSVGEERHQRHMLGVVQYLMLCTQFDCWGGFWRDGLRDVGQGNVSVLSSSHPDVAGQNICWCAVGEAGEEELFCTAIGIRFEEKLIASAVVVVVVGCHKEITH